MFALLIDCYYMIHDVSRSKVTLCSHVYSSFNNTCLILKLKFSQQAAESACPYFARLVKRPARTLLASSDTHCFTGS